MPVLVALLPCGLAECKRQDCPVWCRDIIANKSKAAAGLCDWAINIVKYYDVVSEVSSSAIHGVHARCVLYG